MLLRRWLIAIAATALLLGTSFAAYSDCHDSHACEEVQDRIVGTKYWRDAMGQSPIRVSFLINPIQSGQPDITETVKEAADLWSDIERDDETTIPFKFVHQGQTLLAPDGDTPDGKNVVGWG